MSRNPYEAIIAALVSVGSPLSFFSPSFPGAAGSKSQGGTASSPSVIRARIFFSTAAFGDRTFASVDLVGWSIIETSVYIITGCLPHLRALVSHYTPDSVKQAIKNTMSSATARYGSKSKGGTSGFSASKSYNTN